MSSSAQNDVLHDTQAASFEAYAKQFLRTYPVLMSLRRDAQNQECSRLQRLLDDGLVYTVYLEGPVKRPGRDYDLVTEWNKWRVVLNHEVSNTDADVALRWVMDHNHSLVVEYIVALECAQYLVNAERHSYHPLDDETGMNILDYASQDGDMGLIRLLLSLDNTKWMKQICRSPRTNPLHRASLYGQDDVVRFFLVECGAAVDAPGMWGRTPLHLAAKNGHLAVVKLLTLYGANAHIKDGVPYPTRNTALHFAAAENHISIVRFLVENCDVDIDEKGFAGGTPLHMAARNGHVEIVEYLVRDCGADVESHERQSRKSAAEIAHSCGHVNIANFLFGEEERRRRRKRVATDPTRESRLEGESMEKQS